MALLSKTRMQAKIRRLWLWVSCATLPAPASAAKRIDKGLILKALGEQAS